jgi:hypothetical protein
MSGLAAIHDRNESSKSQPAWTFQLIMKSLRRHSDLRTRTTTVVPYERLILSHTHNHGCGRRPGAWDPSAWAAKNRRRFRRCCLCCRRRPKSHRYSALSKQLLSLVRPVVMLENKRWLVACCFVAAAGPHDGGGGKPRGRSSAVVCSILVGMAGLVYHHRPCESESWIL